MPDSSQTTDDNASPVRSVPAFQLPESAFLSADTRRELAIAARDNEEWARQLSAAGCPAIETAEPAVIPEIRQQQAELFYQTTLYQKLTERYPTDLSRDNIDGVPVEIFTPQQGIAAHNRQRVLLNFHGGSFTSGSGTASHQESIPIAALGRIKVISVDYRMGPEHRFPAASDDALAVYRALLNTYPAQQIGIFGCSSGAMLAAQLMARLQQESLPKPAALSMSCWAAHPIDGDSNYTVTAQQGIPPFDFYSMAYFKGCDLNDPLVIPGASSALLASFPSSLLMTATRDFLMSTVVHSHAELVRLGVEAQLHVWDGLEHGFLLNPELEESRQSYRVLVDFFERHLG